MEVHEGLLSQRNIVFLQGLLPPTNMEVHKLRLSKRKVGFSQCVHKRMPVGGRVFEGKLQKEPKPTFDHFEKPLYGYTSSNMCVCVLANSRGSFQKPKKNAI